MPEQQEEPGQENRIQRACFSHPGKQRPRNEDACALPPTAAMDDRQGVLLALADGVGGMSGGQEASREAVNYLQAIYYAAGGATNPPDRLRNSFEAVNQLNHLSRSRLEGKPSFLTTLVAAVLRNDDIWIANVGDSRAYLAPAGAGELRQLTEDHSGQIRNKKAVQAGEPAQDDRPGLITHAIGLEENPQVDLYHYNWAAGDRLILCSDGLSSLPAEEMTQLCHLGPADQAAQALVERAVQIDGSDNCTAVVAVYEKTHVLDKRQRPDRATIPAKPDAERSGRQVERETAFSTSTPGEQQVQAPDKDDFTNLETFVVMERSRRMSIALSLLVGLLLGWLSAAVLILYWLGYLW